MERQIQVLVFTADVRVQVPPRPPKKAHLLDVLFYFMQKRTGNQVRCVVPYPAIHIYNEKPKEDVP